MTSQAVRRVPCLNGCFGCPLSARFSPTLTCATAWWIGHMSVAVLAAGCITLFRHDRCWPWTLPDWRLAVRAWRSGRTHCGPRASGHSRTSLQRFVVFTVMDGPPTQPHPAALDSVWHEDAQPLYCEPGKGQAQRWIRKDRASFCGALFAHRWSLPALRRRAELLEADRAAPVG